MNWHWLLPIVLLCTPIGILWGVIVYSPWTDENGDGYATRLLVNKIREWLYL